MRFVEVSHRIEPGMTTYPGLPQPVEEVFLDYDDSRERYGGLAEFRMASLRISGNTGTYIDAPIHRHRGATDLADLPLDRLAHVPLTVIDALDRRAIGPDAFAGADIAGRAVLLRTGFSRHFGTEAYAHQNPYLTAGAAALLAAAGPALVGIDSLNIDDTSDASRPAHTTLLAAGIPICEHMTNLDQVPETGGLLHAVPIAWVGGTSFPVRAYVMVPDAGDARR